MALEIKLNNRTALVELLARDGNLCRIKIDDKEYDADIVQVERGVYSILIAGRSFNIELIPGEQPKSYYVNTYLNSYTAEIVDAEVKYRNNRQKVSQLDGEKVIVSPMPGKVVKINCKVGDEVVQGQTLIVVSAMKMESEFKAKTPGHIAEIRVNEGETVEGKQVLIVIE
ncbi:MAG: acetyl-CoA carboxylase biotin carboxyl carrier protein subunit [Bacteroidales bacterium]|nr:acetyl-CoA carboxylase biotin carboxyl carrier protein subunit [Bacteroidales bacterium]MDD3665216.1 acetyl-CoA carboxylase biotin carboxyl carrier protein subunit [Bacteroidales bacterium]